MGHRILRLAKTTRGSRDARRDYKLPSLAALGRSLCESNALPALNSVNRQNFMGKSVKDD